MIKGYIPPKKEERHPGLAESMLGTVQLFNDLKTTKEDIIKTSNTKIKEIDSKISEVNKTVESGVQKIDEKVTEFEKTATRLITDIHNIPQIQGNPGKNAEEVDTEKLVKDILAKLPKPEKFDEKGFIKKVISAIPQNKASLKVIRETFETDPMSIIDKIMALKGEFKLKTENIDGLEQTIQAFRSQLARGYLHGGGDTVKAGTNVTITKNTDGSKTVNAFEGAGVWLNDNLNVNARLTVSAIAPVNPAVNDLWYQL